MDSLHIDNDDPANSLCLHRLDEALVIRTQVVRMTNVFYEEKDFSIYTI